MHSLTSLLQVLLGKKDRSSPCHAEQGQAIFTDAVWMFGLIWVSWKVPHVVWFGYLLESSSCRCPENSGVQSTLALISQKRRGITVFLLTFNIMACLVKYGNISCIDWNSLLFQNFNVCESCSHISQLYNKVSHQKYDYYSQCKAKVTNMRVADSKKATTTILQDLLANDDWITKVKHHSITCNFSKWIVVPQMFTCYARYFRSRELFCLPCLINWLS